MFGNTHICIGWQEKCVQVTILFIKCPRRPNTNVRSFAGQAGELELAGNIRDVRNTVLPIEIA